MVPSISSDTVNRRRLLRLGNVFGLALLAALVLGRQWPAAAGGIAFPISATLPGSVSITTTTYETSPGNTRYQTGVNAGIDAPTGVILAAFDARSITSEGGNYNVIAWETGSELNMLGFNLWRGTSADAPTVQLNEFVIPSQAPGSTDGATYGYDDLDITSGLTYYYWLEEVDLNGVATRHGPAAASLNIPTAVTLTDLQANSRATNLPWPMLGLFGATAAGWVLCGDRTRSFIRQLSQRLKQRFGSTDLPHAGERSATPQRSATIR